MPIPTTPRVVDYNMTSFMAYVKKNDKLYSGLMVVGAPADGNSKGPSSEPDPVYYVNWYWTNGIIPSASNYVFKQMFWGVFSAPSGYIRLNVNTLWQYVPPQTEGTLIGDKYHDQVWLAIKFGNKWIYKDGTTYKWGSSFNFIRVGVSKGQDDELFTTDGNWDSSMNVDEGEGLYFPITSIMIGEVSVYIYPKSWSQGIDIDYSIYHFGTFITKLDIDYVPLINNERPLTDRSENIYSQSTSKYFRDTLDLSLDLASDANNLKQASLLWNNATTPAKLITLNGQSIRPEVDLLNRLAAYYGAARQRLELEVAHPTAAPLPLLKLNGINDGKVYLPLSESRDWQTGVCKLTCFETPN